jgi:hypothetical protein
MMSQSEVAVMELPIRFPSEEDVITEDVARFRALSDQDQVRTLGELFSTYHFLAARATKPEAIIGFAIEEEERARRAVEEFVKRHG